MRRTLLALLAAATAVTLTGCGGHDDRYRECIAAGGTYHWDGWSGSETCALPKSGGHR